jgi:hypothetical protein
MQPKVVFCRQEKFTFPTKASSGAFPVGKFYFSEIESLIPFPRTSFAPRFLFGGED